MIDGIIGEDAAKYVYGMINYAKEIMPYTHSFHALNLSKKFAFAEVGLPSGVLMPKNEANVELKHLWKVKKNFLVSKEIHCIELESDDYDLNPSPFGYEWMGFHFSIKCSKKLRRFYSLVMVNLKNWSLEIKNSGIPSLISNYLEFSSSEKGFLRLFIKKYPNGNMSKRLCEMPIESIIKLKGPYGPGLGVYKLPRGPCLAFGAGTGEFVYLDLVYAIWKEKFPPEFSLYLYLSFKSRKEAVALDLIEATQRKFRNQLKLQVNLDEEGIGGRLTETMLQSWIQKDIKKVWICGPAGFNRWIEKTLQDNGIEKDYILIL